MPFKNEHPLYRTWASMKDRCRNPNSHEFHNYGGRGIIVCDRWNSFKAFAEDMGPRPDGTSLDRIDVDGNYEPSNCRWADRRTQQRNRRHAVFVEVEGRRYRAIELAESIGVKVDTITDRASKGMSLADVLSKDRHVYTAGLALGGKASGERQAAKTHCPKGHEYTPANTYTSPQGWRTCRICHNAKMRRRTAAKLAAAIVS